MKTKYIAVFYYSLLFLILEILKILTNDNLNNKAAIFYACCLKKTNISKRFTFYSLTE